MILSGGTYYFDSLRVNAGASVQIGVDNDPPGGDGVVDGPPTQTVTIYIAGQTTLNGQGITNPFGQPTDLSLVVSAVPSEDVVQAGDSEFRGFIYAPYTEIKISGTADMKGAAVGKSVVHNGGAPFHYDESLEDAFLVYEDYQVSNWTELF
jgi:hypothetical protein